MNINRKKTWTAVVLPLIAMSSMLPAARNKDKEQCAPEPAAVCYPDDCCRQYCMGPENYGVNAPVRPLTCNGDFVIDIEGFYWNAHQDGMEYAIQNSTQAGINPTRLIDASYKTPDFNWEFGFKLGLAYNTTCDGWDFGVLWTRYQGKASSHDEAELDDNQVLYPLWSAFGLANEHLPLEARDIQTQWKLDLNLVDIELGREFWVSKKVTLRPHMGLRVAYINQDFNLTHRGGTFNDIPSQVVNYVDLDNDFHGVGIRGGLNSVWNFGCGFALYGNMAVSLIYGRFNIDHDEYNRETSSPFDKTKILETKNNFSASRLATDLGLGIQWSALMCDCNYALTVGLGWEQHLFLDQNQMWRVNPDDDLDRLYYSQRRGDLDTQGWTLSVRLAF